MTVLIFLAQVALAVFIFKFSMKLLFESILGVTAMKISKDELHKEDVK
jgi:hypothetical protein